MSNKGPTRRAREALVEALRTARRDAKLTGSALADQLGEGWSQPKVSKIELGRQLPTEDEVRAWAAAVGADVERLLAIQSRAAWEYSVFRDAYQIEGGPVAHQKAYAAAETAATTIVSYHPTVVPGLLQTAAYASALLRLEGGPAEHGASDDEISRMVAARMRRAAILHEPDRDITVLMGEAVLHHRVGDTHVMRAQLEHLANLATSTHAVIGVIPFERFPVLVQHGWDQRDQVITLETTAGDLEIADPIEVAQYERWAKTLAAVALTGSDAAHQFLRVRGDLTS